MTAGVTEKQQRTTAHAGRPARAWTQLLLWGLVLALAFAVRLYRIDAQPVWWDESYSWSLAKMSLWEMVQATAKDVHPPLYYALLHFWVQAVGESEYALRFPSAMANMATIALVIVFAARVAGTGVATLGGLFAALAPLWVHYAQEARAYTLETLIAFLATVVLYRLLVSFESGPLRAVPRRLWLAYISLAAVALWVDYFPVLVLIAHSAFVGLWFLVKRPPEAKRFLLRWCAAQLAIAALYLPWAGFAVAQITGYGFGNVSAPSLWDQIVHTWRSFIVGTGHRSILTVHETLPPTLEAPLLLGTLALLIAGLVPLIFQRAGLRLSERRGAVVFLLASFALPVLAFFAVLTVRPFYHPRYILVATPGLYVLLAAAAVVLGQWRRWALPLASAWCVIAFVAGLVAFHTNPEFAKQDARPVLQFIGTQLTGKDLIIWETPHPFLYYYNLPADQTFFLADWVATPDHLAEIVQGKRRVFWVSWLVGGTDPWRLVPFLMEKHGHQAGEVVFPWFLVRWYDLDEDPRFSLGDLQPLGIQFGDFVELEAAAFGGEGDTLELSSGSSGWVVVRWRSLRRPPSDLKFSVQVRDERGHVVGQDDRFLFNRRWSTARFWKPGDIVYGFATPRITPGTPPGRYSVEISLYQQNLHSTTEEWSEVGAVAQQRGRPVLGTLEIVPPATPASPEALPVHFRFDQRPVFGPVELVGYEVGGAAGGSLPIVSRRSGEEVPVALFWHARQAPQRDLAFTLDLVDANGEVRARATAPPARGRFPTSQWRAGETLTDWRELVLPAGLSPGTYRLRLLGEEGDPVDLAQVHVLDRPRSFAPPTPQQRRQATLGDFAELLGFDIEGTPRPGQPFSVVLYWRALGPAPERYAVFVHFSDAQERIWAQHDGQPLEGQAPTTGWAPGEVLADRHTLRLPPETPPGTYTIYMGLYDPLTGQRLFNSEGSDRLTLTAISLMP